jgi:DNA-binding response OmpR family regulator
MESKPKLILVIDDDDMLRNETVQTLMSVRYEVKSTENGVVGVDMARQFAPDLIVCKTLTPKLDGYKVWYEVQEFSNPPFLFLTRFNPADLWSKKTEISKNALLRIPFSRDEFLRVVESNLVRGKT